MAKTKEQLISDIQLQLHQSVLTDDIAIEDSQIASWASDFLNELVRRECTVAIRANKSIPTVYIHREIDLPLTEEAVADVDDEDQRMYLELLEGEILDIENDRGIVKILDYDLNLIHKTSTENLEIIGDLRFAKATSENPLYYREGSTKIFIKGLNTADLDFNNFMVHYVRRQDVLAMEDTDEIKATDQIINALIDMCVAKGKAELYGTQPDVNSDGRDVKQLQYHRAIANPAAQEEQPQPEQ